MSYCVYCHTNKINGKKYIGITKQNPIKRWANGKGYRNQPLFEDAIIEYGWKNFTHEILFSELTKDEAERLEVSLIKKYQTASREHGYNVDFGGISKCRFGDDHRKHLSKSCMGRKPKPENIEKLRKRMTGKSNPMYGRKRSNEPMKCKKSVICLEIGITYESTCEASRKTGVHQSDISKVCNGKLQTAGGYHWSFLEEE